MPFSYPAAVCRRNDLLIYIRLCFFGILWLQLV